MFFLCGLLDAGIESHTFVCAQCLSRRVRVARIVVLSIL